MVKACLGILRSIQLVPKLATQKNAHIGESVHHLRILALQSVAEALAVGRPKRVPRIAMISTPSRLGASGITGSK
jgi:hypothetical protein